MREQLAPPPVSPAPTSPGDFALDIDTVGI
jgi:hypothetical protein